MSTPEFGVEHRESTILFHTPGFRLTLDTSAGLRAITWENLQTGHTFSLGSGPEFEVDLDAAEKRLWIEGWRASASDLRRVGPDQERGFRKGFHRPHFDDSPWKTGTRPNAFWWRGPETCYWTRTHLFLPRDCAEPILGSRSYFPTNWQGWRVPVAAAARARRFELAVAMIAPKGAQARFQCHYVAR